MKNDSGMTEIVKTITSLIEGAIIVFGINIILYGHLSPGGGFAGGLILAFFFVLYFMAFGKKEALARLSLNSVHILDSLGAITFLCIGLSAMLLGKNFLYNYLGTKSVQTFSFLSGGIIPIENIAIGIKVGASIFLVFAVLSIFRISEEE